MMRLQDYIDQVLHNLVSKYNAEAACVCAIVDKPDGSGNGIVFSVGTPGEDEREHFAIAHAMTAQVQESAAKHGAEYLHRFQVLDNEGLSPEIDKAGAEFKKGLHKLHE